MEKELIQFAEELANKFLNLNKLLKNNGISSSKTMIFLVNKDEDLILSLYDGELKICYGECSVKLQDINKNYILELTGYQLLKLSTVVSVKIYADRDKNGFIIYDNPFKFPF